MDLKEKALKLHQKYHGKLEVIPTMKIKDKKDLSLAYTPGVAAVSSSIAEKREKVWNYTIKSHTVAVITDGSAVLGLGNIGSEAALPVMEGKCALFKIFAGIDAFPICLKTQNPQEIIEIVKNLTPVFGGVNLEDIAAPNCFIVEENLQDLGIPVMHDDQHGTAVVVLAGLINAAKVAGKNMKDLKIMISGAGAAGQAIARLISKQVESLVMVDSKGIISSARNDLDPFKKKLLEEKIIRDFGKIGGLRDVLIKADVFIGVSKGNLLTSEDIKLMEDKAIVFAMANPTPEIMPDEAKKGGAFIVATGRSDFPNQINNVLAFPGIFKGALEIRASRITEEMKLRVAEALASLVKDPTPENIIPDPFDKRVVEVVAQAIKKTELEDPHVLA